MQKVTLEWADFEPIQVIKHNLQQNVNPTSGHVQATDSGIQQQSFAADTSLATLHHPASVKMQDSSLITTDDSRIDNPPGSDSEIESRSRDGPIATKKRKME